MKIKCNRCGRCCTYLFDGIEKRCKFLIGEIGKITVCRIYMHRSGTKIDSDKNHIPYICSPRKNDKILINGKLTLRKHDGCPFNE